MFAVDFHIIKVNGDWSCQGLKKEKKKHQVPLGEEGANVSIKNN